MSKRKIISIDENLCNGCSLCIPNCPEGALQIIDGKARLISDLFCDGLGACIGHCPEGAITIQEREAEPYSERKVMGNIIKQGKNVIKAHLEHLKSHGANDLLHEALAVLKEKSIENPLLSDGPEPGHGHPEHACPSLKVMDFKKEGASSHKANTGIQSELSHWPVQITLVPPTAPYLNNSDLLIAADCVPFAYADFHRDLLQGKTLLVGCPKLDDIGLYKEKITQIFKNNTIRSATYAHMEVPCCYGLIEVIKAAIADSGKKTPFNNITISIKGQKK